MGPERVGNPPPEHPSGAVGPLAGLVVVELAHALAGPHAAMMLGDLGARVIKIEHPDGGDDTRQWGPPFAESEGRPPESTYFLSCNRNKESVVLDLKSEQGGAVFRRLIDRADVLIENFRPGVLERLGLAVEDLRARNQRLVVLSITGFGRSGPDAHRVAYDQILQGEGGLMSFTGPDAGSPTRMGVPIADLLAGMYGAFGVLGALHRRQRTGRGEVVHTSLLAAVVATHSFQGTRFTVAGEVPRPRGNQHPSLSPYGAFAAADGVVQIAVGSELLWQRFAPIVGLEPDDSRFASNPARVAHRDELVEHIESVFSHGTVEHWLRVLADAGVPVGRVRSLDEVYAWEQTAAQGLVIEVDHESLGTIRLPGPPLQFDDLGAAIHRPPPVLGQHTESVLRWLGGR